jgi:hypothetical protein
MADNTKSGNSRRRTRSLKIRGAFVTLLGIGPLIGLFLMTESQARAYIDPGSGLFTLQIIGASFAGGVFFLRQKLKKLLVRGNHQATSLVETALPRKPAEREMSSVANDASNKKIVA